MDSTFKVLVDENNELVKAKKSYKTKDQEEEVNPNVARDNIVADIDMYSFEPEFVKYLKSYDEEQKQRDFDKKSFTCGVCFDDKPGRDEDVPQIGISISILSCVSVQTCKVSFEAINSKKSLLFLHT